MSSSKADRTGDCRAVTNRDQEIDEADHRHHGRRAGDRADKRNGHRVRSLNVLIEAKDEGLVELADKIGYREYDARHGRHPRNKMELALLVMDVASVVASLNGR